MNKTLISLVAMMGLCATTGCMAPVEAEEIEGEPAEAEQVGEAEAALWHTKSLSCSIEFPTLFQPAAVVTNPSLPTVPIDGEITIKVFHSNGHPNVTRTVYTDAPLFSGDSLDPVMLTHSNALDAISCTATAKWET